MSLKDAYERKLQAQLKEWNAEIGKLKAQADRKQADTQIEYYQKIAELEALQETAREKLDTLEKQSDDAWEDLKAGVEYAVDALSEAVRSARSRFK